MSDREKRLQDIRERSESIGGRKYKMADFSGYSKELAYLLTAPVDVAWLLDEIERLEAELEVANHYAELAC